MKKVIWTGEEDLMDAIIYCDYEKDFPQLGSKWICRTEGDAFTDCDWDVDDATDEYTRNEINSRYHEECDEEDYEYVRGLVEAWGI